MLDNPARFSGHGRLPLPRHRRTVASTPLTGVSGNSDNLMYAFGNTMVNSLPSLSYTVRQPAGAICAVDGSGGLRNSSVHTPSCVGGGHLSLCSAKSGAY